MNHLPLRGQSLLYELDFTFFTKLERTVPFGLVIKFPELNTRMFIGRKKSLIQL